VHPAHIIRVARGFATINGNLTSVFSGFIVQSAQGTLANEFASLDL
jgi:hypothetical protein